MRSNLCDFERMLCFYYLTMSHFIKRTVQTVYVSYTCISYWVPKLIFSRGSGALITNSLGGVLIRSGALIWSWAIIQAFMVCSDSMGSNVVQQYCNIKKALRFGGEFDPRILVNKRYRTTQRVALRGDLWHSSQTEKWRITSHWCNNFFFPESRK